MRLNMSNNSNKHQTDNHETLLKVHKLRHAFPASPKYFPEDLKSSKRAITPTVFEPNCRYSLYYEILGVTT